MCTVPRPECARIRVPGRAPVRPLTRDAVLAPKPDPAPACCLPAADLTSPALPPTICSRAQEMRDATRRTAPGPSRNTLQRQRSSHRDCESMLDVHRVNEASHEEELLTDLTASGWSGKLAGLPRKRQNGLLWLACAPS